MTFNHALKVTIYLPLKSIKRIFILIAGLSIVLLCCTVLHHSRLVFQHHHTLDLLLMQFNLAHENVVAAWYSSMLLFLVAVVAAGCYLSDAKNRVSPRDKIINTGWLFVALAFAALSFDEMGSFHESIAETGLFKKMAGGRSKWFIFYLLGFAAAVFMATFYILKFRKQPKVLLFSTLGFLLLLSIPFQERFEHYTWDHSPDPLHWKRPGIFLAMEEGCELLGFFCFLLAFTLHALSSSAKHTGLKIDEGIRLNFELKKSFLFYLIAGLAAAATLMAVIYFNSWHLKMDDAGRPQNWFPSFASLMVFLVSGYQYFKFKKMNQQLFNVYAYIAITSIVTSAYFGADIYNYQDGIFYNLRYFVAALTILSAVVAVIKLKGMWSKFLIICWAIMMVASVFTKQFFNPPLYGLLGFGFLLLALYLNAVNRNKPSEKLMPEII